MKIKNIIITIILLFFSFYYTNKVSNYIKNKDPIMIKIKNISNDYKTEYKDATILDNTIIPGLSGYEVDINKSYHKMKKIKKFQTNLLVYNKIKPKISLNNNLDKIVINGNLSRNRISILLKVDNLEIFDNLKKLDCFKNMNFIFNYYFLLNNQEYFSNLDNNIVMLEENFNNKLDLVDYCYSFDFKNICSKYGKVTIKPVNIKHDYSYNTLKVLKNGIILNYNIVNEKNIVDLNILISKIKSLNYEIVLLDKLLEE